MADTDATGFLYFTEQLRFCVEAFESCLIKKGFKMADLALPIVHAEADYSTPLRLWDEVEIRMHCKKIGSSSFRMAFELVGHGTVEIVHVLTDAAGKKQAIAGPIKELLAALTA